MYINVDYHHVDIASISDLLITMAGSVDMGQLLADQLVKAAKVVEEQLDAELNKLDNMDEDEMEALVRLLDSF